MFLRSLILSVSALSLLATPALATTFTLSPGGLNRVQFESEAPLETVTGLTTEVSGSLSVDAGKLSGLKGTISVPVAKLSTGNAMRDEHMRSPDWLDAAANPNISVEITGVTFKRGATLVDGKTLKGKAQVKVTIKGKTKSMTVPVSIGFHKLTEALKRAYIKGDLLRVKTSFELKLADFGIAVPDSLVGVKLADTVTISAQLSAVATPAK